MTASMDDGDTLVTDLGIDHQLIIKEQGWKKVRAITNKKKMTICQS